MTQEPNFIPLPPIIRANKEPYVDEPLTYASNIEPVEFSAEQPNLSFERIPSVINNKAQYGTSFEAVREVQYNTERAYQKKRNKLGVVLLLGVVVLAGIVSINIDSNNRLKQNEIAEQYTPAIVDNITVEEQPPVEEQPVYVEPEIVPEPIIAAPEPVPAPDPVAEPAPAVEPHYDNCDAVRAAGAAPIYPTDPGWQSKFDRDNDGIGCD